MKLLKYPKGHENTGRKSPSNSDSKYRSHEFDGINIKTLSNGKISTSVNQTLYMNRGKKAHIKDNIH